MAASNSRGVRIMVVKAGATAVDIVPTDISSEAPAVVSSVTPGIVNGMLISIPAGATGMPSLDGRTFVAANVVAGTSFELLGSDATDDTYTAGADPNLKGYADSEMINLCLSSMTFNSENPETVSVGTYCDPSATIPGTSASAGTVDIGGFVDITAADYQELVKMADVQDRRMFRIMLPNNGFVVFDGALSNLTLDIPISGAIAYTGQIVLASKPRHLF